MLMAPFANAQMQRDQAVTLYWGRWGDTRLLQVPQKLITGSMDYFEPQLVGVSYLQVLTEDAGWLRYLGVGSVETEVMLIKHTRVQDHWEADIALGLRSFPLIDQPWLGLNFQMGNGFSWAFDYPTFEKGPEGIRGENTRQFQYHMNFEFEFSHPGLENLRFSTRLHHRSGIYGLISPRRTGSNYLGFGVRYGW